jgi:hypothetical protein
MIRSPDRPIGRLTPATYLEGEPDQPAILELIAAENTHPKRVDAPRRLAPLWRGAVALLCLRARRRGLACAPLPAGPAHASSPTLQRGVSR